MGGQSSDEQNPKMRGTVLKQEIELRELTPAQVALLDELLHVLRRGVARARLAPAAASQHRHHGGHPVEVPSSRIGNKSVR